MQQKGSRYFLKSIFFLISNIISARFHIIFHNPFCRCKAESKMLRWYGAIDEYSKNYPAKCTKRNFSKRRRYVSRQRLVQPIQVENHRSIHQLLEFYSIGKIGSKQFYKFQFEFYIKSPNSTRISCNIFAVKSLGNHEFDDGIAGFLPFAKNVSYPLICANCDFSQYPDIKDLIKPYIIKDVGGKKIGIIGYLTIDTTVSRDFKIELKHTISFKDRFD